MRENRTSGSEGGEAQTNELSLPLSFTPILHPFWKPRNLTLITRSTRNFRPLSLVSSEQRIHDLEVPKSLTVIEIFRVESVTAGAEGCFDNEGVP